MRIARAHQRKSFSCEPGQTDNFRRLCRATGSRLKENLMQVTIDGVPFVPACASASRIGIAITTHNRSDVLNRAIEQHIKHLPAGALVVVIDDGSKPAAVVPDGVQLLRHETSLGIVASKNASLTLLT